MLAAVQAFLLKALLFGGEDDDTAVSSATAAITAATTAASSATTATTTATTATTALRPSPQQFTAALVEAVTEILWRAGGGETAILVV